MVGFLNPLNLLWILALAVLALIYLRSRSRPTIEVSSLMLFDEMPAPVARVRHVRIDPLFWLEVGALSALILAIAGLYAMVPANAGHGRSHALVFDVGAAMGARSNNTSGLDQAKKQAAEIIDAAPIGDEFSVITYALEAQVVVPQTQNLEAVRKAIDGLSALAVPAHASALAAAVMRSRGSSEIELFTDRPPSGAAISDARAAGLVHVHQIAHGDDNVAIVSLDSGVVGSSQGRAALRNFSAKPRLCDLQIKLDGRDVFHRTLMFAPREQMLVPFGPLPRGGLLAAQITTPDALAADNQRWIYAPSDNSGRALALSPDPQVREQLARVMLAINPNLQVATADPARFTAERSNASEAAPKFDIVVMHDSYVPGIAALSTLLVFPPAIVPPEARIPGMTISAHTTPAILSNGQSRGGLQAALLPSVRPLSMPEWMDVTAFASRPGADDLLPVAAIGRIPGGRIGVIAFDVRDNLLLDPDRLDALVTAVNLIKRLAAPDNLQVLNTGSYVNVPVMHAASVTSPDGARVKVEPDRWGRVKLRTMQSGRYVISSGGKNVEVFANYFDASESDLAIAPAGYPSSTVASGSAHEQLAGPRQIQPLLILLAALAMAAFIVESIILIRHAARWGLRHV